MQFVSTTQRIHFVLVLERQRRGMLEPGARAEQSEARRPGIRIEITRTLKERHKLVVVFRTFSVFY